MTINDKVDNTTKETLRGKPFIRKVESYEGPKNSLERSIYGNNVERKCGFCFYGYGPKESTKDCSCGTEGTKCEPKTFFNISQNTPLPSILEGKEVAQYCPFFLHYNLLELEHALRGR
jgi:hypothetical protein